MKLCFSWLKSRRKVITVCTIVIVLFAASYLLFGMPAVVVLYGRHLRIELRSGICYHLQDHIECILQDRFMSGDQI